MGPDDLSACSDESGGVTATVSVEGVVRIPCVPRGELVVIQVELLERILTDMYGKGLSDRPVEPVEGE